MFFSSGLKASQRQPEELVCPGRTGLVAAVLIVFVVPAASAESACFGAHAEKKALSHFWFALFLLNIPPPIKQLCSENSVQM